MLLASVYFWLPSPYSLLLLSRRFATTLYDFFFSSFFSWQVFTPIPLPKFLFLFVYSYRHSRHISPPPSIVHTCSRFYKKSHISRSREIHAIIFFFFLLNTLKELSQGIEIMGFVPREKEKKKKTSWGWVAGKLWVSRGPSGEAVAGFEVSVTVLVGRNSQQYVCASWSCLELAINSLCISAFPRRFQITHLSPFVYYYFFFVCCRRSMLFNGIVLHKEQIHERLWRLAIPSPPPLLDTECRLLCSLHSHKNVALEWQWYCRWQPNKKAPPSNSIREPVLMGHSMDDMQNSVSSHSQTSDGPNQNVHLGVVGYWQLVFGPG